MYLNLGELPHLPDLIPAQYEQFTRCTVNGKKYILIGHSWKIDTIENAGANNRQVGGSHYGLGARQHWDIVVEFDLDYFQGQITKYVMRWNKKNGIQDLKKAQHFLEKYIEEIQAGRIKGEWKVTLDPTPRHD